MKKQKNSIRDKVISIIVIILFGAILSVNANWGLKMDYEWMDRQEAVRDLRILKDHTFVELYKEVLELKESNINPKDETVLLTSMSKSTTMVKEITDSKILHETTRLYLNDEYSKLLDKVYSGKIKSDDVNIFTSGAELAIARDIDNELKSLQFLSDEIDRTYVTTNWMTVLLMVLSIFSIMMSIQSDRKCKGTCDACIVNILQQA